MWKYPNFSCPPLFKEKYKAFLDEMRVENNIVGHNIVGHRSFLYKMAEKMPFSVQKKHFTNLHTSQLLAFEKGSHIFLDTLYNLREEVL